MAIVRATAAHATEVQRRIRAFLGVEKGEAVVTGGVIVFDTDEPTNIMGFRSDFGYWWLWLLNGPRRLWVPLLKAAVVEIALIDPLAVCRGYTERRAIMDDVDAAISPRRALYRGKEFFELEAALIATRLA